MQSAFSEMLKEGTKIWTKNLRRDPSANYKYAFESLFRYYSLSEMQNQQLTETFKTLAESA